MSNIVFNSYLEVLVKESNRPETFAETWDKLEKSIEAFLSRISINLDSPKTSWGEIFFEERAS